MAILPIHSALQNPDIAGNFQQGLKFGTAQRLQRQAEQEQQQLRELAPAIQSGDPAAFGQAAVISPEYASAQQSVGDGGIRRLKGAITFIEQAQKTGNPRSVEAAYQQVRPYLARFGQEPPATFAEAEPKFMEAKARIAMLDSTPKEMPSGFQQFKLTAEAAGLVPGTPEYQKAARIALGQEGRAASGGYSFEMIKGADGRERPARRNPRDGSIEVFTESGWMPLGGPAAMGGAPLPSPPTFTGPDGIPIDVSGVTDPVVRQQIMQNPGAFNAAPDMSTAQLPPTQASNPAAFGVGRAPEEQAGLTTAAQEAARTAALAEQERIKADSAVDQAVRTDVEKAQAEKAMAAPAAIQTLQQSLDSIDALLADPGLENIVGLGSINPLNRIPGTAARGLIARADQIAGQSFLAAFNQLKGGGAITEKEGEAATRAIARLDRSQSLEDYKTALNDLRDAISPAIERLRASQRPAAAQAQAQRGRQVVRTGTLNGRRVVQYSDGTTDYAD